MRSHSLSTNPELPRPFVIFGEAIIPVAENLPRQLERPPPQTARVQDMLDFISCPGRADNRILAAIRTARNCCGPTRNGPLRGARRHSASHHRQSAGEPVEFRGALLPVAAHGDGASRTMPLKPSSSPARDAPSSPARTSASSGGHPGPAAETASDRIHRGKRKARCRRDQRYLLRRRLRSGAVLPLPGRSTRRTGRPARDQDRTAARRRRHPARAETDRRGASHAGDPHRRSLRYGRGT